MPAPTDIRAAVERRAQDMLAAAAPPVDEPIEVDSGRVRACLDANERGDGVLFAEINQNRYRYNITPDAGEWYRWRGTHWEADRSASCVRDGAEAVAARYAQEADKARESLALEPDKKTDKAKALEALAVKYERRVERCRSWSGVEKMLRFAGRVMPELQVSEDQMDRKPLLLPCPNGVIDLERGILTEGRREDLLTRAIAIPYDPSADTRPCMEFLVQVLGSEEEAAFLQRSLGVALTGYSHEQYLWLLIGDGRNGKGVLRHVLAHLLGPYYHEINAQMLVASRNAPSAQAASEHVVALHGRRLIVAGETNDHEKVDARALKKLTGEDILNARPNFKSEINFAPTHSTWLLTNHMLHGIAADFSLVQRLLILEFPFSFVDDPASEAARYPARADCFRQKDPFLKDRLLEPGSLRAWLKFGVDGCRAWRERGLGIPQSVIDRRDKHARESDYFREFFADCIRSDPGGKLACSTAHKVFTRWFRETQNPSDDSKMKTPALKTLNNAFRRQGYRVDKSGVYYVFDACIPRDCPYLYDEQDQRTLDRYGGW